jgi:hypothetical protein
VRARCGSPPTALPGGHTTRCDSANACGVSEDDFLRVEARDCPMSACAVPAGSPCRTSKGKVGRPVPHGPLPARATPGQDLERPDPRRAQARVGVGGIAAPRTADRPSARPGQQIEAAQAAGIGKVKRDSSWRAAAESVRAGAKNASKSSWNCPHADFGAGGSIFPAPPVDHARESNDSRPRRRVSLAAQVSLLIVL